MTDLETELRAALAARADAIHEDDLRGARQPRRRVLLPVLAAAAVVAAVAVEITLVATHHRSSPRAAGGVTGLDGYSWQLVSVTTPHDGTVPAPPATIGKRAPFLSFSAGTVQGDDDVNAYSGTYRWHGDGFIADTASTLVAYAGPDRRILAAQAGFQAVLTSDTRITARVTGDSLVLRAQGYTLQLHRSGRVGTPTPSVSSTPAASAPCAEPTRSTVDRTLMAGVEWRLVSVTTPDGTFAAPAHPREQPRIVFCSDGSFVADDSVNTYEGRYRPTGGGYTPVGSPSVSAVGTIDDTPALRAIRTVTGALTSGAAVTTTITASTLVLRTQGVSATYRR